MTSVVRLSQIINGAGAVLTSAPTDSGDELAVETKRRVFAADDVGAGAGQTRDATDPTVGCLVAQITGSRILGIKNWELHRVDTATNRDFEYKIYGDSANTTNIGFRVSYDSTSGVSSVYIIDAAADAPGQIVADDILYFDLVIGSSNTLTPIVP